MSKPRILSIDDENNFTDLLKQYFEPRGYMIDIASAGDKGVTMFGDGNYDVVLLDLRMEGINGDEVMRELRSRNPGVRIIFVTAYSDAGETRERLLGEGAYAYVEKPIGSLRRLEELVNGGGSASDHGKGISC